MEVRAMTAQTIKALDGKKRTRRAAKRIRAATGPALQPVTQPGDARQEAIVEMVREILEEALDARGYPRRPGSDA
jgi:hypothetical protein